jgi:hypothetical protein
LTGVLGEMNRGVFMMATGSRATPDIMESIAETTKRPTYISTVLTMYNEATPELGLSYYDRCAQALDRGNPLYVLTSCQALSFDFTLLDPYVMLSHSAFDAVKSAQPDELPAIYRDTAFREAFRLNLKSPKAGILFLGNWKNIEVGQTARPEHAALEGMTIAALAAQRGVDPVDAFFDLALSENLETHFVGKFFNNNDDGVAPLLKHRASVITLSDAGAHLSYMCDAGFGLHFLAHWVRETGHFSLSEGIRRLTSEPADRFCIPERGRLTVGSPADMLLFDPATVGISKPLPRASPRACMGFGSTASKCTMVSTTWIWNVARARYWTSSTLKESACIPSHVARPDSCSLGAPALPGARPGRANPFAWWWPFHPVVLQTLCRASLPSDSRSNWANKSSLTTSPVRAATLPQS